MLFVGQAPERRQQGLLPIAEAGRTRALYNLPGVAFQRCRKPAQPVRRQLPLAKFELIELLIGRANQSREIPQREPTSLSQFLKPIRQEWPFGGPSRL